jgi:2'-5' RNA ligase
MSEIVVVAPLTTMKRGDKFQHELVPLHVTTLPNWTLWVEVGQASVIVQRIAGAFAPFEVRANAIEQFGPRGDIEVVTLEHSPLFTQLHGLLLNGFAHLGVAVNPEYNGDGFRPHATTQLHAHLKIGESRIIDRLAVVDCTEPVPIVTDVFPLKG